MINIISGSTAKTTPSGPQKVVHNLLKGLDILGYPYQVNRHADSTTRLWVHDSPGLVETALRSHAKVVLGPNLFVMPRDIPVGTMTLLDTRRPIYIHPSQWAVDAWLTAGFSACPLQAWPVGVDVDDFPDMGSRERSHVLVYHKQRCDDELEAILGTVRRMGFEIEVLRYGGYTEDEYRTSLAQSCLIIWHGCHESQGLALEEALATNTPALVVDVASLGDAVGGYDFGLAASTPATAAPYFDSSCGVRIGSLLELEGALAKMYDDRKHFTPRDYVLRNLSLCGQARAFVDLWQYYGLSFEDGLRERPKNNRRWGDSAIKHHARRVRALIPSCARQPASQA
jgi:hypothetical protein